jgi:hypothetical protein
MSEENGSNRLDRIERALENITERMDLMVDRFNLMVEHHDHEFRALNKWQVVMQGQVDSLITNSKKIDERIDKLVTAIGNLIERLPPPPESKETPGGSGNR